MKRLLPTLILLGVFTDGFSLNPAVPPIPNGPTATCQDLTVQLDGTGNYSFAIGSTTPQVDVSQSVQAGSFTGNMAWQSFTAGTDGVLHSVGLTFSSAYAPTTTATVSIYSGEGLGGTLLTQMTYSNPISFNAGTSTEFVLKETVDVVSGSQYTVVIADGSAAPFSLQKNDGDPYAGGRNNTSATSDFVFNSKVLQRPDVDNGSFDNAYGVASFGLDVSSFDCSNLGANTVTLTITDNNGGSSTCTSTVTVEDNEAPVAVCKNISIDLDGLGDVSIFTYYIDNGSSDNCSVTLSLDITQFDCGDVGPNTVTLTAEDPAGNTDNCTSTVTVVDATAANAVCQDKTLVLDGSGSATLLVSDINNGSTDNCAIATKVLDQTSFNCSDIGTNTVTLTITDVNSNVSSCTATVTVEDNQTPSITCPSDITVCSLDASGATVTYAAVTGSDNCGYTISQTDATGLTSGSTFPIGTTTQDWGIEDVAGNTNSCSFTVTVDATPVADYSFSPACAGESVFFTDESTITSGYSISSWTWNMDDGSGQITLVDPIHVFADTGMYDVALTVVSANGCSSTSTQTVHVTPVPTASFTYVGACEGNATAFTNTSTIDAGTLTYAWDFGDGNTSTDQDPSNTYAVSGTYTVTLTVTSDNGCEDVTTTSVNVADSPTALFSATTACEGDATVFTNLSTGAGTLTYAWDFGDGNTSTDANPSNTYATGGTYTVVLTTTNNNGCIDTHTADVTVNSLPNVDFTFSNVCEGTQANFVNTSSSGTYNWDLGDGNSSTLSNVNHAYSTFGTYDVTLTVTSSQFCVNSLTQQIEIYDLPDFTLTPTDVACYGEMTGSITAVILGSPTPPLALSLNNGTPQSGLTFTGLSAGNYDVTTVDANGCSFTVSTTVDQPADTLGINLLGMQNNLCNGDNSGEISVVGTGGTAPYTYAVDAGTPQSSGLFSGLAAGSHDIEIVDAHSCVFDTTIILSEPPILQLGLVASSDLLCNGDNSGSISVASTGGVSPYGYNLDGGTYDVADMFENLAAGNYIVGTMDANGCTDTIHVTLTEPGILMLSLINSENALCNGQASGSIEVAAASGTSPYQYSMDGVSFQGSGVFDGLGAGSYTLTVRDANGCTDNLSETLTEPTELTVETNSSPVACFGEMTGEIEIIADGGTASYEYSVDGGSNFFANGGTFTDLSSGIYLAVVRDANGCTASEGVIVSQPNAAFVLTANITNAACLGESSGEVMLVGNGGTPTYLYSDDNASFVTGNTFGGYAAGFYTLYAQDQNGCVDSVAVNVTEPTTAVNITGTLNNNPACPNQSSGTVTVMVTGGTPGYTYSSNGGATFQSNQILSGLNGGNHLIVAMDSNGCTDTDTVTLVSPELISITVDTVVGVACEGQYAGEIHVTAQGGTPSYNYFLNGGSLQTNGDYVNLTNGTYTVSVTDVNGCPQSTTVDVEASTLLPVANFDYTVSGTAILFSNTSANGSSYMWTFGDDSTSTAESPVHVYDHHGTYTVTLTVTNDCGEDVYTVSINTLQTGIADAEAFNFAIYPNPANSELFVQPSSSITAKLYVDVISTTGQILKSTTVNGLDKTGRISIDVNGLSNGIYYLRLVSENEQTVLRFDVIR
ncbi:MAG: PKD domain-containing protein [Flavobacteriales bacterium]|nr:PKD domain-containing protein [Flavobacteriales bacterium]